MQFTNGVFLNDLWEKVHDNDINLQESLQDVCVIAVRMHFESRKAASHRDTEYSAIESTAQRCSFVGPEILVFPLTKTGRNLFPNSIVFGRALTSDICLASHRISKLHGWFEQNKESGVWSVYDHYSTNGTWVNDYHLHPDQPRQLQANDEIQIGDARALFLDAEHLEMLLNLYGVSQELVG